MAVTSNLSIPNTWRGAAGCWRECQRTSDWRQADLAAEAPLICEQLQQDARDEG